MAAIWLGSLALRGWSSAVVGPSIRATYRVAEHPGYLTHINRSAACQFHDAILSCPTLYRQRPISCHPICHLNRPKWTVQVRSHYIPRILDRPKRKTPALTIQGRCIVQGLKESNIQGSTLFPGVGHKKLATRKFAIDAACLRFNNIGNYCLLVWQYQIR
jgi:hypothetical protein